MDLSDASYHFTASVVGGVSAQVSSVVPKHESDKFRTSDVIFILLR